MLCPFLEPISEIFLEKQRRFILFDRILTLRFDITRGRNPLSRIVINNNIIIIAYKNIDKKI